MNPHGDSVNIAGLLERSAERRGPAAGIVAPDGRTLWTFHDLAEAAARLAGGLAELGIGLGDRVVILEPDTRELYRLIIGVIWAGAAAMIPPLSLPFHRALRIAGQARPTAVIASPTIWPLALTASGLRNAPTRLTTGRRRFPGTRSVEALAGNRPIPPARTSADNPAVVTFTTGSTGANKAITRSHGVLRAQHEVLAALRPLDEAAIDLAGLPMLVLHNLGSAVTSVPAPRGAGSSSYGARIRAAIARTGATGAAGFPHLFESALNGARAGDLDRLRSIYVGGSRVRPALLTALRAAAPGARVMVVYGSTEVEPISAIGADEYLDLLASREPSEGVCVGSIIEDLELQVEPNGRDSRDPESRPRAPAGRILVRGPRAARGAEDGGWLDTGDLGRIDGDGRLWLLGRSSNSLGDHFPVEVERLAEALPWVDRAALVGPGTGPTSRTLLAVQPRRWGDPRARAAWLDGVRELARDRGWQLDEIVLLRHLPVVAGAAAKVDDEQLRRRVWGRRRRPWPGTAG